MPGNDSKRSPRSHNSEHIIVLEQECYAQERDGEDQDPSE
jgi:hypothetical protein